MGVYWAGRDSKWASSIRIKGDSIYLGGYVDKFDAICARKSAEHKHGFHANHGAIRDL